MQEPNDTIDPTDEARPALMPAIDQDLSATVAARFAHRP
jgi:hypothetical protein